MLTHSDPSSGLNFRITPNTHTHPDVTVKTPLDWKCLYIIPRNLVIFSTMVSGRFSSAGVADVTNPQTESDKGEYVLLFTAAAKPPLPVLYIIVFAMHVPCDSDGSSLPSN
jgi:hypothetical protein